MHRLLAYALCIFLLSCAAETRQSMDYPFDKINGVSFVAPSKKIDSQAFQSVRSVNANWVSLMPYSFCPEDSPVVLWNYNWQWWGEKPKGLKACIKMSHEAGLKVLVKPQIWMHNGAFTGELKFDKEADWQQWETDYSRFILHFAKIAQEEKAEMFCIGTELSAAIKARPHYWKKLIRNIRKEYDGPLTYAANWDEYERSPLWAELDYIGIDAYFPLAEGKSPNSAVLKKAWRKHAVKLRQFSEKQAKPILFTEYGYRSIDYACEAPWDSDHEKGSYNPALQERAYEALYEEIWTAPWFAGGFAWKWYDYHEHLPSEHLGFTPQNKTAENSMRKQYGKSASSALH